MACAPGAFILLAQVEVALIVWGPGRWATVCYLANYSVVLRKPEAV